MSHCWKQTLYRRINVLNFNPVFKKERSAEEKSQLIQICVNWKNTAAQPNML